MINSNNLKPTERPVHKRADLGARLGDAKGEQADRKNPCEALSRDVR